MIRKKRTWLGLTISVAAIWFAARGVDWGELAVLLREADPFWVALVVVAAPAVNVLLRAIRWQILLSPAARPSMWSCTSATAIGLMANNVLPARVGEFVRAYALGRREPVPTATAFGGLFVERMFDGFAHVGILFTLTLLHEFPGWVDRVIRIAAYVFIGFLGFQIYLVSHPRGFVRFAQWVSGHFFGGRFDDPIERALVTFVDGFHLLKRPLLVIVSAILAAVQWILIPVTVYMGFLAFRLVDAGWLAAFFSTSVTALGVAIPSSPGFVGTFQAFMVESLGVFGVDRTRAFTLAVGFHAVTYIATTAVGLAFFLREGLSWRDLERSEVRLERDLEDEYQQGISPGLDGESQGAGPDEL